MNLTLELPDGALRRRVLRILAGFPDIAITNEGGTRAAVGDADIALPEEPVAHLLHLLSEELQRRSGVPATRLARTLVDAPLDRGTAVSFPTPTGTLWADEVGGVLLAPTTGDHCGVLVSNDSGAYAVSDEVSFVEAIVTAAPIVAAAERIGELEAAKRCGVGLAERA